MCICLHVECFSIWVARHFMQNWNATSQFFATDPSNQKWSLIDCKTASRTSRFSPGLSADPIPPPATLCSSSSVSCQSIRTKCLCDGRRQSVSKQGENKMVERRQAERRRRRGERKEERGSRLSQVGDHCPI